MMSAALWVMLGGAFGGPLRFGLTRWVERRAGGPLPWGTLTVNVTGAFAIGVLAATLIGPGGVAEPGAWQLLAVGLLGSYTTVSSFSLQTLVLLREGRRDLALWNMLLSVGLCVAAVGAGWLLARAALSVVPA